MYVVPNANPSMKKGFFMNDETIQSLHIMISRHFNGYKDQVVLNPLAPSTESEDTIGLMANAGEPYNVSVLISSTAIIDTFYKDIEATNHAYPEAVTLPEYMALDDHPQQAFISDLRNLIADFVGELGYVSIISWEDEIYQLQGKEKNAYAGVEGLFFPTFIITNPTRDLGMIVRVLPVL